MKYEVYACTGNNKSHRNSNIRFKEILKAILGKHSTDWLQKTHILRKPHIIRKGLQSEITTKFLPYKGNGTNQEYQIEMTPVGGSCDHHEG